MSEPKWVTEQRERNTNETLNFIKNVSISLYSGTDLEKLRSLKFDVLQNVEVAKQSFIAQFYKKEWSEHINKFQLLATTKICKKNLNKFKKYL